MLFYPALLSSGPVPKILSLCIIHSECVLSVGVRMLTQPSISQNTSYFCQHRQVGRRSSVTSWVGCFVSAASILFGTATKSFADQRLAVVVPIHHNLDFDIVVSSLKQWPAMCSHRAQNMDLVLYFRGRGTDDYLLFSGPAESIAGYAGRCFSRTRTVYTQLQIEVNHSVPCMPLQSIDQRVQHLLCGRRSTISSGMSSLLILWSA